MRVVAIIQARMGSSRLPNKVLADLGGMPALAWVVRAARAIVGVDRVAVATSIQAGDEVIAEWCRAEGVACHRGSESDVLDRYCRAAEAESADVVVRLTADCPLLDPAICAEVVALVTRGGCDYATNSLPVSWPNGLDCEAVVARALLAAGREATLPSDREHVTPFVRAQRHRFPGRSLICPLPGLGGERWTLDTQADLDLLRAIVPHLPASGPGGRPPAFLEVLAVLDAHPPIRGLNAGIRRNEGYAKSLAAEEAPAARLPAVASRALRERTQRRLPFADAPLFLSHGRGGHVWDVDGNDYIDLLGGRPPSVLGHGDPDVDRALRDQLAQGTGFGYPTTLDAVLARRLVDLIPGADWVRFDRDAETSRRAALRLARARTGRTQVAALGSDLPVGDLGAVERLLARHGDDLAAVVVDAAEIPAAEATFPREIAALLGRHGVLLILDESITAFRYALGGAQARWGIVPDISIWGAGMGCGMAVCALVGRDDALSDKAGEARMGDAAVDALSLAGAIAAIDKMQTIPVIDHLWRIGTALGEGLRAAVDRRGFSKVFGLVGDGPWMRVRFGEGGHDPGDALLRRLQEEMRRRGVLIGRTHAVCDGHTDADVARVLAAYDDALVALKSVL